MKIEETEWTEELKEICGNKETRKKKCITGGGLKCVRSTVDRGKLCWWFVSNTWHKWFLKFILWIFEQLDPLKTRFMYIWMLDKLNTYCNRDRNNKWHKKCAICFIVSCVLFTWKIKAFPYFCLFGFYSIYTYTN